jgi:predicted nucleic acid-binding protein
MNPEFVLDTCVVSDFEKTENRQNHFLREWIRSVDPELIVIPIPVVFELQCGVARKRQEDADRGARLEAWVDRLIASGFRFQPVTLQIARLEAEMVMTPSLKNLWLPHGEKRHQQPGQDLVIAATAITLGCTVVTANVKDFAKIGEVYPLRGVFNPFQRGEHAGLSAATDADLIAPEGHPR